MKCKRMLRGHSGSGEVRGGKTRRGPGSKGALSLAIACLMLLGLCGCQGGGQEDIDLTNLTVEFGQPSFSEINLDLAAEMMAEQNGMNAKIGTQKLEVLQDAVQTLENCAAEAAEAGGHVTYYQMTTPFFVPEIEDFQGAAHMLVVVADGAETASHESRYIRLVEAPSAENAVGPEGVNWIFQDSSADVNMDGSSASFHVVGYFEVSGSDGEYRDSDTLSLEFTFSADMIEGL